MTELLKSRNALRCKWVFKMKTNADGFVELYKGFSQIEGFDNNETFSLTVRYATMRYLMSLVAKLSLRTHQLDAITASLQGDLHGEQIYMEQPEGFIYTKYEIDLIEHLPIFDILCEIAQKIRNIFESIIDSKMFLQGLIKKGFECLQKRKTFEEKFELFFSEIF